MSSQSRDRARTLRTSRPPSLSTIDSVESLSPRPSKPGHGEFSVSNSGAHYIGDAPPRTPRSLVNDPRDTLYSPYHKRAAILAGRDDDEDLIGASDDEREVFDEKMSYPRPVAVMGKSRQFEPDTASISPSSHDYGMDTEKINMDGEPVKYMKTEYMWMLLSLEQIPWWHNLLVSLATWIVLAAYLVVPGTFTSFEKSTADPNSANPQQLSNAAQTIVKGIDHIGLLALSGVLAGIGGLICTVLGLLHWSNAVWLSSKIFQPMMLNAFAGLVTTIVNVYASQKGVWSISAKLNACVTGGVAGFAGALFVWCNFFWLSSVRGDHHGEFPQGAELVNRGTVSAWKAYLIRILPKQKGLYC